jgi:hypothetical protein
MTLLAAGSLMSSHALLSVWTNRWCLVALERGSWVMRRPAQAAGMASLQQVLESGFSSFSRLGDASDFLSCIGERESQWISLLFDARLDTCQRLFSDELAQA